MLRQNITIIFFIASTVSLMAQNTVQDYVNRYSETAVSEMQRTGIPASVLLAQGVLESSFGNSQLAIQANNHFNIACGNWQGELFYQWSPKEKQKPSCYRVYDVADESYMEYSNFLIKNKSLSDLLAYQTTNYKKWANAIHKEGLIAKGYPASQLIMVIETYELAAFDGLLDKEEPKPPTFARKIHNVNGLKAIVAEDNDNPLSVAQEFNIPLRKILKYNDLKQGSRFQNNQFVFLEAKRTQAKLSIDYHVVRPDETIYDIAQLYGIKLKAICKLNHLEYDDKVAIGERINLVDPAVVRPRLEDEAAPAPRKPKKEIIANNKVDMSPENGNPMVIKPLKKSKIEPAPSKPSFKPKKRIEPKPTKEQPIAENNPRPTSPPKPQFEVESKVNENTGDIADNNGNGTVIPGKNSDAIAPAPSKPNYKTKKQKIGGGAAPVPTIDGVPADDIAQKPDPFQEAPSKPSKHIFDDNSQTVAQIIEPREGYHVVLKGETLYRIALKYRVTVEGIRVWNELKDNQIEVGQELKVSP
mgnify:CR=1 FL=1